MPINLDWHAMRLSELRLSTRATAWSALAPGAQPVLRAHHHHVSPIDERWGLQWKHPHDVWERVPFNMFAIWRHEQARAFEMMSERIPRVQLLQSRPLSDRVCHDFFKRPSHWLRTTSCLL
jgi:hypothetical protein